MPNRSPKKQTQYERRKRAGKTALMLWLTPAELEQLRALSQAWVVAQRDAIVTAVSRALVDVRGGQWKCLVCGQYSATSSCAVCLEIRESRKTPESKNT